MILNGTRQEHILDRLKTLTNIARMDAPDVVMEHGLLLLLARTHRSIPRALYQLTKMHIKGRLYHYKMDLYEGWLIHIRQCTRAEAHERMFGKEICEVFAEDEL